jgi:type I restriction enzyme, R subunit
MNFWTKCGDYHSANFAVELLQKLLNDEIRSRSRTNVVIEKKFSERLQAALNRYRSRAVESAQVIEELIGMAKEFRDAANRGEKLGLNDSELAFYDALAETTALFVNSATKKLTRIYGCGG